MLASRHFGKFAHLPDDSRAKDNNEKSIPWNISQPKKSWKCGLWTFLWAVSTNFYPFSVPFISISDTVLKSLSPCSNCKKSSKVQVSLIWLTNQRRKIEERALSQENLKNSTKSPTDSVSRMFRIGILVSQPRALIWNERPLWSRGRFSRRRQAGCRGSDQPHVTQPFIISAGKFVRASKVTFLQNCKLCLFGGASVSRKRLVSSKSFPSLFPTRVFCSKATCLVRHRHSAGGLYILPPRLTNSCVLHRQRHTRISTKTVVWCRTWPALSLLTCHLPFFHYRNQCPGEAVEDK